MDWTRYIVIYGPYVAKIVTAAAVVWLVWLTRRHKSLLPQRLSGWLELLFFLALVYMLREALSFGISFFPMALAVWLWWLWYFRKNRVVTVGDPPAVRTMGEIDGLPRGRIALALLILIAAQSFQNELSTLAIDRGPAPIQAYLDRPTPDLRFVRVDDGSEHRLSDFKGRVVLLHFWRPPCPSCVEQMHHFDQLHRRYADDGLAVIHLSPEGADPIRDHLRQYPTPTVHASTKDIGQFVPPYHLIGMPNTGVGVPAIVILDREGVIRRSYSGGPWSYKHYISGVAPYL